MNQIPLSNDLRRFIHSIASIPHLEAMLLLHQAPVQAWDAGEITRRLYLNPELAIKMLSDLCVAGICEASPDQSGKFIYAPASNEIRELIDQLAHYYSCNLIEVTNMIHSRASTGRRAQQFADAFKFDKEK